MNGDQFVLPFNTIDGAAHGLIVEILPRSNDFFPKLATASVALLPYACPLGRRLECLRPIALRSVHTSLCKSYDFDNKPFNQPSEHD